MSARSSSRRAVVGVVIAVALLVTGLVVAQSLDRGPALPQGVQSPEGGIAVGEEGAVVMDQWFDFACPACATAGQALSETVGEMVESGELQAVFHPLSFVTPSGSARAANAFGCASDADAALEYYTAVLDAEPKSDEDLTNSRLLELGAGVGIDDPEFPQCVEEFTYREWVENVAVSGLNAGIAVTPTFFVNGEQVVLSDNDPQVLREEIESAAADE